MRKILGISVMVAFMMVLAIGCENSGYQDKDDFEDTGGTGSQPASESRYIKIAGSTFFPGNEPESSATGPTVTEVSGMFSLVNGGAGNFLVKFNYAGGSPNDIHASSLADIKELIVAVELDPGYLVVPIPDPLSGEFTVTILVREDIRYNSMNIRFAVRDADGNVSNYIVKHIVVIITGTGDVKVSLTFDRDEDLDLHVWEPNADGSPGGEHIYFAHKTSATGGQLDLDSNAGCSIDGKDNENIYWPRGFAPDGTYMAQVHYWAHCTAGEPVPVNWIITTIVKGEINTYTGLFLDEEEGVYKPSPAIEFTYMR